MAESVVKTHKRRWDFDWSIILTRQTPALTTGVGHGQHRQVLYPKHPAETRTGHVCCQNYTEHPSPEGHPARAPRRAWTRHLCSHQQRFPVCKISNKSLFWAAQAQATSQNRTLHNSKCHTWQSRSDFQENRCSSLTWDDRNGVFLPGYNANIFLH